MGKKSGSGREKKYERVRDAVSLGILRSNEMNSLGTGEELRWGVRSVLA